MSSFRVLFIGCNPSLQNKMDDVPFVGTKSGVILDQWIEKMGLNKDEQCVFMNLTKYATKSEKQLKKSDVNLKQFKFELGIKLIEAYHGTAKAFSMMISAYQNGGVLDEQSLIPNKPEEVEEHMKLIRETPLAKIVTLGEKADWGFESLKSDIPHFKLPHPSGLNRKLNDKEALEKLLADCKAWLYS